LFRYNGNNIVNEKGKVLDVHGGVDAENRQVIMWNKHNGLNQQWDIVYVDTFKGWTKKGELNKSFGFFVERPFYIVSELPSHRYIDLIGSNTVIKTPNGFDSQKWYFDQKSRTIKNLKQPNKSFDIQNAGRSTNLQLWSTNSGWFQIFRLDGMFIECLHNKKVFDVQGGKDTEGQNVLVWNKHGKANQRWRIVYVDSKQDQTKGLNKEFGFFSDRPFYIVSRLPMRRAMAYQGGNNLYIKNMVEDNKDFKWIFDGKSKTIKTMHLANTPNSLAILSNGGNSRVSTEKTNARWW
jgi:hypothetical protein